MKRYVNDFAVISSRHLVGCGSGIFSSQFLEDLVDPCGRDVDDPRDLRDLEVFIE